MNNRMIGLDQIEEKLLSFEVADEALEAATSMAKENGRNVTLAFCSGLLQTCPGVTAQISFLRSLAWSRGTAVDVVRTGRVGLAGTHWIANFAWIKSA